MRSFILLTGVLLTLGHTAIHAQDYQLVWQEHFDGNKLNETFWNYEIGNGHNGWGNRELQYYTRENTSVADGVLTITARRETREGYSFTSSRLTTRDKMHFTHGKIEIRAKMPLTTDGLWPAMWALGQDASKVGWPRCGEIDFVEMGHSDGIKNGTQQSYFNGAMHWGFYKDRQYPNYANSVTAPYSMQDDFHLYTIVWDTEKIAMYYDLDRDPNRAPYFEMPISDTEDDWAAGRYFHKPVFLIFNVAVGGNFPGIHNPADITALPNDGDSRCLQVDYIKIYQLPDSDHRIHIAE